MGNATASRIICFVLVILANVTVSPANMHILLAVYPGRPLRRQHDLIVQARRGKEDARTLDDKHMCVQDGLPHWTSPAPFFAQVTVR